MKRNKKLLSLIVLSMLLAKPYNVFAAGADSFRTDEYKAMGENVLDLINAAGAYAQGYTGKGVTVGVTDVGIVNFSHPEFSGKTGSGVVFDGLESSDVPLTWEEIGHPTHVAGIAAADKNGFGMHGVAYDADIAGSSVMGHYYGGGGFESSSSFYDNYLTNPDIKIINNSWGDYNNYLSNVQNEEDFNEIIEYLQSDIASFEIEKAVNNDKLLVFSAANSGHLTAALENNLDILIGDKAFNDNIITVTAAKANSFKKNNNGGFDVESDAIAIFSDLAMYNEDTTLSASGWNINSANADFAASGEYYSSSYGTSMAAPIVTGVGALVQQAFPYLGGKQIGDVLLSTANSDIIVQDSYFITTQYDTDDDGTNHAYLNVYYFDSKGNHNTNVNDDIIEYYKENLESGAWIKAVNIYNEIVLIDYYNEELLRDLLERKVGFVVNTYYNVPLDVIFGQGIVDAGKAVNGLGAINVRRLDKSDISENYTVQGNKENQALYTVNTQGYNSVWSNDISEIRAGYIAENPLDNPFETDDTTGNYDETADEFAGLTDLHDRWVFYADSNNKFDETSENWMIKYYMQQYNEQVKESGLAGLHAGLYKTGDGILALTGDNTYKGASIAAGGTLQIDGRVAGDAYSEGAGTIAGSGIISGSLYNNGAVEAGSWGAVNDKDGIITLDVGGNFIGNGVISVNTDGEQYGIINVLGTADVSGMSLKAGTFAAPGVTGTILTVGKNDDNSIVKTLAITDTKNSITGAESLNTDFSGMLNGKVTNTGTKLELTTSISNNAGINGARFNAFNSLYNNLNAEEKQEMQRLYALNNNSLNNAVNELTQSESMHMELARDAIQNRDVRQAVTRQQHLDRDEGLWAITGKNWGETDGGITRHSYNLTLGKDFYNIDNAYMGALFAYNDNSIGGNNADGEYKNYSLGIYGGSKNSPGTVTGYVSYGVQDNELTRHLGSAFSHSGMGSKLESDYDSSVIGIGAKYAYDLHYGKEGWHVSPYAALDYAHYKQDSFTESGSVFGVHSGGFSDNYLTGELGFDFNREEENGKYGFSLAYKRILDGDTLDADFAFAKGGNGFGVQSIDGSKNHIVATAYISSRLSDKWEIGGTLLHDWSSTDRDLSAAVNLNYYF